MPKPRTGYELREHTADVALYVWGDTAGSLFQSAADGLYAVLGDLRTAEGGQPTEVTLADGDLADLLGDFLAELLFLFETARARLTEIHFHELRDGCLRATGLLQPLDRQRSHFDCEVKAVTRHNLAIERTGGRFETTIILDL